MSNTFMNALSNTTNYKLTENGAIAHRTTNSAVYDLFSFGAAYRSRSDEDCILLFKNAYEEDKGLALKCLFYIRDCRGGQGERRFFRVCFKWLAKVYPFTAARLLPYLPEYGRYDDWFELLDTEIKDNVLKVISKQLSLDMISTKNGISLLGKWMPSENASSQKTIERARIIRNYLGCSSKEYRKMLTKLRAKINVLETLMSANRWDEIEFDKIPSRAGLIYKNAFARRDVIAKKYETFAKSSDTKVNAGVLYPYEVVAKATPRCWWGELTLSETDRAMINKYWENLPDYLNGADASMLCVVDTSGSMTGSNAAAPINVAISLGLYCAEHMSGPFANQYISFASRPQLIKTEGIDFVDKVQRIYKTNLVDNTDLPKVFDLLLDTAILSGVKKEDIPKTIVVISDMEIDSATSSWTGRGSYWTTKTTATEMEKIRQKWTQFGLELPKLIYWNVEARHNTILDSGPNVSFVSGMSPVIFKQVLTGKSGYDLMLETLNADRYKDIC